MELLRNRKVKLLTSFGQRIRNIVIFFKKWENSRSNVGCILKLIDLVRGSIVCHLKGRDVMLKDMSLLKSWQDDGERATGCESRRKETQGHEIRRKDAE